MYRNKFNALLWTQKKTGSTVKMLPVRVSAISFDVSENSKPILCGRRLLLELSVKLFYGYPANAGACCFNRVRSKHTFYGALVQRAAAGILSGTRGQEITRCRRNP